MSGFSVDVAIIGTGPAGMAAALKLHDLGIAAAVFDEQPSPGGQIYRNILEAGADHRAAILGTGYTEGLRLVRRFVDSGIDHRARASVWRIAEDGLSFTASDGGGECASRRVLVATGAMERPFPVEGWTLPGVMTAGAAQILLKLSGSISDGAVFAGCGPLLYLVVAQYLKAGVRIAALLDTAEPGQRTAALRHLPAALTAPGYLAKGAGMLAAIRRAGVSVHRNVAALRFLGDDRLMAVAWRDAEGEHELECGQAFVHQGVVPMPNATMAARCAHEWDARQLCWRPKTDPLGRTTLPWLWVAGDAGGIGGARSAALAGEIAALGLALDLGRLPAADHDRAVAPLLRARRRDLAVRPFLDTLYRPRDAFRVPQRDNVIVCRCEEVRRGALAAAAAEGCPGPNQLKSFTRAGMGPCQGRLCGLTVTETLADLSGTSPARTGYYRLRMPIKPVTVGEIAGITTNRGDSDDA